MKVQKTLFLTLFFSFFLVVNLQAGSPVWQVMKGENMVFIGATVHVLSQDDYPLPPAFESAYSNSSILIFETDLQNTNSPEYQQLMMKYLMLPDGKILTDVLKHETYKELEKYMDNRGIPLTGFMHFKPGMLAMTLTVLELKRLGIDATGVDKFFTLRASEDQKNIEQLETVEQQLQFLGDIGQGHEDETIMYTLRDMKELPNLMTSLTRAWKRGDIDTIEEIALLPFAKDFPKVHDQLLVQRNNAWVPQIEKLFNTKDIEFVLVGALHLIGKDSVLAKLAAKGYKIRML